MDALGESISITLNKGISIGFGFSLRSPETFCHYVSNVNEGSPAERAGLCVYDIIMQINATETRGKSHVSIVEQLQMEKVELQILRPHAPAPPMKIESHVKNAYLEMINGISANALGQSISITLNTVPGVPCGFTFESQLCCNYMHEPQWCYCDTFCHYVSSVQEGSPEEQAGLRVNDIICEVNKFETYKGVSKKLILEKIQMGKVKLQVLRPHAG